MKLNRDSTVTEIAQTEEKDDVELETEWEVRLVRLSEQSEIGRVPPALPPSLKCSTGFRLKILQIFVGVLLTAPS